MIALSGLGLLARPELDRSSSLAIRFSCLIWYYQFDAGVKLFLEPRIQPTWRKSSIIPLFSFHFPTD
jgi:hypothetical protein